MFKSLPRHLLPLKRKEGIKMGDIIYDIEVFQGTNYFVAKINAPKSKDKPIREFKTSTLEELLEHLAKDILEEVD